MSWRSNLCALALLLVAGCNPAPVAEHKQAITTYRTAVDDQVPQQVVIDQWPAWRGGSLHAVASAKKLPTSWNHERNVRWRIDLPGRGNSSPIVWDDHVFITCVEQTAAGQQASIVAIDRDAGQRLWQCRVGMTQGVSHSKNGFASATPATDGERIYAAFGSLGVACCDMQGQLRWQVPFHEQQHEWGSAASPLLIDNLVIHVVDGKQDSAIVALDKYSGNIVWRTPRESSGSWSSPVVFNAGSVAEPRWQIIVNGTGGGATGTVIAYDPSNGRPLWTVDGTTDIPCPTAVVGDGMIISASGSNGPVFALRPNLEAADLAPEQTWRLPNGGPYVPTGVIYQQRLFMISDAGMATCLRLSDGQTIWRKRLQGTFSASLVAGGGHLYAVNERGDVYVFRPSDKFELIATNRLHEPCVATPALVDGEVFLRTHERLYCIEEPANVVDTTLPPADVDPVTIVSPTDVLPTSDAVVPATLSTP